MCVWPPNHDKVYFHITDIVIFWFCFVFQQNKNSASQHRYNVFNWDLIYTLFIMWAIPTYIIAFIFIHDPWYMTHNPPTHVIKPHPTKCCFNQSTKCGVSWPLFTFFCFQTSFVDIPGPSSKRLNRHLSINSRQDMVSNPARSILYVLCTCITVHIITLVCTWSQFKWFRHAALPQSIYFITFYSLWIWI